MPTKKHQHTPIVASAASKPVTLKNNYGTASGGYTMINSYSDEGHDLKEQFLRDGKRWMMALGHVLGTYGFTEMQVRMNRAGIAVSGEVYGEFFHPEHQRWLYVWIEASCIAMGPDPRADGLTLSARWHEPRGKSYGMGPNNTVTIADSTTTARQILLAVFPGLVTEHDEQPTAAPAPVIAHLPTRQPHYEQVPLFAS